MKTYGTIVAALAALWLSAGALSGCAETNRERQRIQGGKPEGAGAEAAPLPPYYYDYNSPNVRPPNDPALPFYNP